jgi:hypothetical protein
MMVNVLTAKYLAVKLSNKGVAITRTIHSLVLDAFIGPPPKGHECCHGPLGSLNNHLSNLSYGTPGQNGLDKRRDGGHKGRRVVRGDGKVFQSLAMAAEVSGCWRTSIWSVCQHRGQTAGGFTWEYGD